MKRNYAYVFKKTVAPSLAVLAGCLMATAAHAQSTQADQTTTVDDVVVTARTFLSVDTSGTTNLPLAIEKVPQSISVISEDFIKAANLKTLGDVADYTAGANNAGNSLGLASLITLRGFSAGRAIDGLSVTSSAYFEPDDAIIDRLEIVKGPSSVVYGVSSPGGLVNYVTKSATASTRDYVYGQYGAWNSLRLEGQAAGALDSAQKIRVIGVADYDKGDAAIHTLSHENTTLYGGLNADISDRLTAYVHGGYTHQVRTAFDGIPTEADGSAAPVSRKFFIGSENMKLRTSIYFGDADLTWKATDLLTVSLKSNYEKSKTDGPTPYAYDLQTDGTVGLGMQALDDNATSTSVGVVANYALDQLGLKDSFITVSGLRQKVQDRSADSFYYGSATANIFDGEEALAQAFESLDDQMSVSDYAQTQKTSTFAVQSLIHPVASVGILLGGSYSKPDAVVINEGVRSDYDFEGKFSFRSGLTYEPVQGLNTYLSFSQSFKPQMSRTIDGSPLAPLEGDQYEAGAKYRTEGGRLLLTGAIYRINQKNKAVYDQTTSSGDYYKALGEVRHQGVELEAIGSPLPQLQLNASYAYLHTEIIDDADASNIGKPELYMPKNTASLYVTYTFNAKALQGVSAGGGFRYVGAQKTSNDGSTQALGDYLLFDANLGYVTGDWIFQINARNLFNKKYYINTYDTLYYGNTVGDSTNVSLSIQRKF